MRGRLALGMQVRIWSAADLHFANLGELIWPAPFSRETFSLTPPGGVIRQQKYRPDEFGRKSMRSANAMHRILVVDDDVKLTDKRSEFL